MAIDRKALGKRNVTTGRWGEAVVAQDMRRLGWTVIEAGYRCREGEIDIIARNKTYLVFMEVKLRKNDKFGTAGEAVTYRKQQRLRTAANLYLQRCAREEPELFALQPRFDVAEIYAPQGADTVKPTVTYIENAF